MEGRGPSQIATQLTKEKRRDRSHAVLSPKIGTFNFFLFYGHCPNLRFLYFPLSGSFAAGFLFLL